MQLYLIISSNIRYDLIYQLVKTFNVTRYYVNDNIQKPAKGFCGLNSWDAGLDMTIGDTGALTHVIINQEDILAGVENGKLGLSWVSGKLKKLKEYIDPSNPDYNKDNCHLVISVTDATHIPDFMLELIDYVYIFQQKTTNSLQSIHDNFLHHTMPTFEQTKQYLFSNLTSKDHYIACSGYPYSLTVYQLETSK